MAFRSGIYIVHTHRWYIQRTVWMIAGSFCWIGAEPRLAPEGTPDGIMTDPVAEPLPQG